MNIFHSIDKLKETSAMKVPTINQRRVRAWERVLLFLLVSVSLALGLAHASAQAPETLSGKTLRVVVKPSEPFVFVATNGKLSGFSVDFWNEIALRLGVETDWVVVGSISEQLALVQQGGADAAISAISITPDREKLMDFSHPYFDAGLRIMVPASASGLSLTSVLKMMFSPGLLKILGGMILVLLVMAHIIWLAERNYNPEMPKPYLSGIWEAFWWSVTNVARQEYGEGEEPRTFFRRLLAIIMVFAGIILIAQFTAAVTTSMTVQQLHSDIRGPEDLFGKQIATVAGSTAAKYLEEKQLDFVSVDQINDAYPLLKQGEVDAILFDSPVLIYWANQVGRDSVEIAGPILTEESYGIALPMGSPLRKQINTVILQMERDGAYDILYEKWFGNQK